MPRQIHLSESKHTDASFQVSLIDVSSLIGGEQAFIQGKQETADSVPASLIVLRHRPVREVSTCNCLHSGEQPKFLSSPRPARPSLPAPH